MTLEESVNQSLLFQSALNQYTHAHAHIITNTCTLLVRGLPSKLSDTNLFDLIKISLRYINFHVCTSIPSSLSYLIYLLFVSAITLKVVQRFMSF